MHCGQTGAHAVGNFTTNITVIFSGFSAKNADDAKNSGSFMEVISYRKTGVWKHTLFFFT